MELLDRELPEEEKTILEPDIELTSEPSNNETNYTVNSGTSEGEEAGSQLQQAGEDTVTVED